MRENICKILKQISFIIETGDSVSFYNKNVGDIFVVKGHVGKSGNGIQHIIEQRFEKDKKSIEEIIAVLALVLDATKNGVVSRDVKILHNQKDIGTLDIEKNGIIAFVSKTRDGKDEKFVITGFDDFSKKEEAGDAIKAVIATNSYAPEFVIVKRQVVATLASSFILHLDELKNNLEKKNLKKSSQELEKLVPYLTTKEVQDYFQNSKYQKELQEATESINAVIARYGQSPEFLGIYAQVGAVIASYEILPHSPEKSRIKSTIPAKSLEDMVYKGAAVTIGNKKIKCRHGLLEEFRKNYHLLEAEREKTKSLTEQVAELKKQVVEQKEISRISRQVSRNDDFEMEY